MSFHSVNMFAGVNPLSVALAKRLVDMGVELFITSSDVDWNGVGLKDVTILSTPFVSENTKVVYVDPFGGSRVDAKKEFATALFALQESSAKGFFVFPYAIEFDEEMLFEEINALPFFIRERVSLLFSPDPIGDFFDFNSKRSLNRLIRESVSGRIDTNVNASIYVAKSADIVEFIVGSLFSFGYYGDSKALFAKPLDLKMFGEEFSPTTFREARTVDVKGENKVFIDSDVSDEINSLLTKNESLVANPPESPSAEPVSTNPPSPKFTDFPKKSSKKRILIFTLFVIFPYITLLVNILFTAYSASFIKSHNVGGFVKHISLSSKINDFNYYISDMYYSVPAVSLIYSPAFKVSLTLKNTYKLANSASEVYQNVLGFFTQSLSGQTVDVFDFAENLSTDINFLYFESGFLISELENNLLTSTLINKLTDFETIRSYREKLIQLSALVQELPDLIGKDEDKYYLVLLQNNMELRPTGGFIGSFATVKFNSGALIDISVSDVYSADGQLKGYVKPPDPIRDYLGEASWFLRDSNWDPDFSVSADRAEWFLDKEMDITFDGVLAVDLEVIKSLVASTGPLVLPDYNRSVDENNLYEITQYEVENNFFPGSLKKKNFLTALTRTLVEKLKSMEFNSASLGLALFEGLEGRHVQIYLHNTKAQEVVSMLGWDGTVDFSSCGVGCILDNFGVVEANVGVNKANLFIERSFASTAEVGEKGINRTLSVTYSNTANPQLGEKSRYKAYVRLLIPENYLYKEAREALDRTQNKLESIVEKVADRKEAGVLIEVVPGQSKTITFSWAIPLYSGIEDYSLYSMDWRKQAGTLRDSATHTVIFPSQIKPKNSPNLTTSGEIRYTTDLARDFVSRIYW